MTPANIGALDPKAMPRQRGRATKNVKIPAGPSCLRKLPDVTPRAPAIGFSMDIVKGSIASTGVDRRVLVLIHLKMQAQANGRSLLREI